MHLNLLATTLRHSCIPSAQGFLPQLPLLLRNQSQFAKELWRELKAIYCKSAVSVLLLSATLHSATCTGVDVRSYMHYLHV